MLYEFLNERTGERRELQFTLGELKRKSKTLMRDGRKCDGIMIDGEWWQRIYEFQAPTPKWTRGLRLNSIACHPDDARETQDYLRRVTGEAGIQVDKETGQVVVYSQKQKVKAAAAMDGCVDLDGGYTADDKNILLGQKERKEKQNVRRNGTGTDGVNRRKGWREHFKPKPVPVAGESSGA